MNYKGLVSLVGKYAGKPVRVLAFPCNEFGAQEPKANSVIAQYVQSTWGLLNNPEFQLFAKSNVNAACTSPATPASCGPSSAVCCPANSFVFKYLESVLAGSVPWNFEKYLVDQKGTPVAKFGPTVNPTSMFASIDKLLAQAAHQQ